MSDPALSLEGADRMRRHHPELCRFVRHVAREFMAWYEPRALDAPVAVEVLDVNGQPIGVGLTWVNPRFAGPWYVRWTYRLTDPVVRPLRRAWWALKVRWLKATGRL